MRMPPHCLARASAWPLVAQGRRKDPLFGRVRRRWGSAAEQGRCAADGLVSRDVCELYWLHRRVLRRTHHRVRVLVRLVGGSSRGLHMEDCRGCAVGVVHRYPALPSAGGGGANGKNTCPTPSSGHRLPAGCSRGRCDGAHQRWRRLRLGQWLCGLGAQGETTKRLLGFLGMMPTVSGPRLSLSVWSRDEVHAVCFPHAPRSMHMLSAVCSCLYPWAGSCAHPPELSGVELLVRCSTPTERAHHECRWLVLEKHTGAV
jgi:hypothetical protein